MLTHTSNLYMTAARGRARAAPVRVEHRRQGVPVQLGGRGERVRDQARPQARPRARDRRARDRRARRAPSTGGRWAPSRRPRRWPRTRASLPTCRASSPCPRDDPDALRDAVGERTAAVMIEPIQGESGVLPVSDEVLVAAREACDASGALLVLDEIQTGMGRTGSLWAYEQTPVRPDVMTTAKALGGGLPAGACVAAPEFADTLQPGDHGSTFAGGPLVAVRRARGARRDRRSRAAARRPRARAPAARGARGPRRRRLDPRPRPDDRRRARGGHRLRRRRVGCPRERPDRQPPAARTRSACSRRSP